ncbi:hypothetical protein GCK72_006465 [Caenorhabditis remanei]|uniref:Uncharacterized protein n=1 Tax=Caenorhabditis remanei TaxID=31234 RepID=A0A6A5HFD9_CAERE|nr:hypothetical protein GCK72_006465 [Caenorhabditis remanei]KAF1766508.1 hypothetical protein GCK72_006465 [Caenorhabditis remanei]
MSVYTAINGMGGAYTRGNGRQVYKEEDGEGKIIHPVLRNHSFQNMIHMPIHASSSLELHASSSRRLRRLQNSIVVVRSID